MQNRADRDFSDNRISYLEIDAHSSQPRYLWLLLVGVIMLLLLFYARDDLYGIATDKIIEIVPMVILRKVQSTPDFITGVFNYHGNLIPAVDLCRLFYGIPCQIYYNTRLILVGQNAAPGQNSMFNHSQHWIGLIAERVTGTLKVSPKVSPTELITTRSISHSPYLGKLFVSEQGIIQQINWEPLVSDALTALPDEAKDQINGARLH